MFVDQNLTRMTCSYMADIWWLLLYMFMCLQLLRDLVVGSVRLSPWSLCSQFNFIYDRSKSSLWKVKKKYKKYIIHEVKIIDYIFLNYNLPLRSLLIHLNFLRFFDHVYFQVASSELNELPSFFLRNKEGYV